MKEKPNKELERLMKPAHPLPTFRKRSEVKVYCGAGWDKGVVEESSRDRCTVYISKRRKQVTCYDARNIEPA